MDINAAAGNLSEYSDKVAGFSLPSWKDLPEIDLYMDQVIVLLEKYLSFYADSERTITQSMINNYVKMEVMPAPVKKRYTREHIAYLVIICVLKQVLPISLISDILKEWTLSYSIESLYDIFGDYVKKTFSAAAADLSGETGSLDISNGPDNKKDFYLLSIMFAVLSNSYRVMSEKIFEIQKASAVTEKK